jgi:hypothetical protein
MPGIAELRSLLKSAITEQTFSDGVKQNTLEAYQTDANGDVVMPPKSSVDVIIDFMVSTYASTGDETELWANGEQDANGDPGGMLGVINEFKNAGLVTGEVSEGQAVTGQSYTIAPSQMDQLERIVETISWKTAKAYELVNNGKDDGVDEYGQSVDALAQNHLDDPRIIEGLIPGSK